MGFQSSARFLLPQALSPMPSAPSPEPDVFCPKPDAFCSCFPCVKKDKLRDSNFALKSFYLEGKSVCRTLPMVLVVSW